MCLFAVSMTTACGNFTNVAAGRLAKVTTGAAGEATTVNQTFSDVPYFTASDEGLASCVRPELGLNNYSWTVDLGDSFFVGHTLMLSLNTDTKSGMLVFVF